MRTHTSTACDETPGNLRPIQHRLGLAKRLQPPVDAREVTEYKIAHCDETRRLDRGDAGSLG
jgi:hypothetical protein